MEITEVKLSKRQQKVHDLLCTRKCSAADVSIALGYSDPRSYIRDIRAKGVPVRDEWVEDDGVRWKRYWIDPEEPHQGDFLQLFEAKKTAHYD